MGRLRTLLATLPRRPWWDGAVAATYVVFGSLYFLAESPDVTGSGGSDAPWRVAVFGVGCALLLLRSRRPGVALAVMLPFAVVDIVASADLNVPVILVIADLLYCSALHGSRWLMRVVAVAALALTAAAGVASGFDAGDWRVGFLALLAGAGILVLPVAWGSEVRRHRDEAVAERANARQLARIAELDRAAAVAAERSAMARDLHDVVAGHLAAIAIQSEAVLSAVDTDPDTARRVLRSVRENSVQSLTEMRAMIGLLRGTDDGADLPVSPARLADLTPLVESARAGGLDVVASTAAPTRPVSAAVELAAYRIVQEALTNALTHACGAHTTVDVREQGAALVVEVVNDLAGVDTGPGAGVGLHTMRERALAVGGTFSARPDAGRWSVHAELPLDDSEVRS